jgi:hypothetical protein
VHIDQVAGDSQAEPVPGIWLWARREEAFERARQMLWGNADAIIVIRRAAQLPAGQRSQAMQMADRFQGGSMSGLPGVLI